ncbi:hypothetical protein DVH24_021832 [Malus domestica]|uniref:Uncharacterized protein n=1 Tax=Malus domestica TaxID=3750 RepID=A0A498ITG7_MALDO|nr:hypothetical protein DVH24_021832 [Malus domestica]
MKVQLSSMTRFFENLVKQVVDHQENLNKKYLEVIEKMEKERREREEAWRCQAKENHKREEKRRKCGEEKRGKGEGISARKR